MANYLIRALIQVGISTIQVASRSFIQAYQTVVMRGREGAASAMQSNIAASISGKIDLNEAKMILNYQPSMNRDEFEKRFDYMFDMNEIKEGGSLYIQSKMYRAYQALSLELDKETENQTQTENEVLPSEADTSKTNEDLDISSKESNTYKDND